MLRILNVSLTCIVLLAISAACIAEQPVQRFKTLADRRDAGFKHQVTEWLSLSPSLEFESELVKLDLLETDSYRIRQRSKSAQLDIELHPADWLKAEVEYEYDDEINEIVLEEAAVEFELDDFTLELGKLYVPFGEFFSRFVSGPVLEFAETRARALVFSYEPDDELETAFYVFKSKVGTTIPDEGDTDWGVAINYSQAKQYSVGFSYLSDLAETEEKLLEDTGFYNQRVDAISAYANIEFSDYEVSFELVQALAEYTGLDESANKPMAWNIELGIYPEGNFDWALRLEGSEELEEAVEYQLGLNNTWHPNQYFTASIEFLHGRFKKGFVEDDSDNEIVQQNSVAAQVILSF